MKHPLVVKMPELIAKQTQAPAIKTLKSIPDCTIIFKRKSSNKSSEIYIKGDLVVMKRRQFEVSETIDVSGNRSGLDEALEEMLEEVAA